MPNRALQGIVVGRPEGLERERHDPPQAPHPNHASRADWKKEVQVCGPICYLLQSLHMVGGVITPELEVSMHNEQSMHCFAWA